MRLWLKFVIAVMVVIAVLAVRGRVVRPPEPPRPGEFQLEYPGPRETTAESYDSFISSFDPVIYGIIRDPIGAEVRLSRYWPTIQKSAEKCGVDPYTLWAVLYIEGQGETDGVSGASCAGIAQFYPPTAKAFGLKVSGKWLSYYRAYRDEKKPAMKSKKWAKLQKFDERFDPRKAIPAAARYLGYLGKKYDREDYAIAAYHMGEPNLDAVIRHYCSGWDAPEHISWQEVVLEASPDRHPETYKFLHDRLEDESWSYYFRVMCAKKAALLWKRDRNTFKVKVAFYDEMARKGRRPRLAHEFFWYEGKMSQVPPLTKLEAGLTNIVVDPGVRHPETTPAMAGFLYYLATQIEDRGGGSIRITSAYRTHAEQAELVKQGRSPSLFTSHRYASGVDVGLVSGKKTQDLLEWMLMVLRAKGDCEWYRERSHYHITLNPEAEYFKNILDRIAEYIKKVEVHRKWESIRPVTLAQGFWGRLFSWPWLLVLAIGIYLSSQLEHQRRRR
ncbi:MAG: Lytic transglycosylase catalytic [Candidatus Berkelbacteria bacterium]|nr:Lytic transglycosylase catalytic [Candidatus Berkelbacteria bacterium]